MNLKKGDIVGRISYGKDILFSIKDIIKLGNGKKKALLKGITLRIEADSPIEDLELINNKLVENNIENLNNKLEVRIKNSNTFLRDGMQGKQYTGRILHLDGDRKYADKSYKYYRELGLNAVVKNVAENRQSYIVIGLLNRYNPDILVITGHDAMLKNGTNYNDLYNYRNSRHFINTVKEARKWAEGKKDLVIFAGACQSYFEALMMSGANFASSPGRILIDFMDPLIVAEKVATTDSGRYITINEIAKELRDGVRGVGGTHAKGKRNKKIP